MSNENKLINFRKYNEKIDSGVKQLLFAINEEKDIWLEAEISLEFLLKNRIIQKYVYDASIIELNKSKEERKRKYDENLENK
jgi:hypothetical protein